MATGPRYSPAGLLPASPPALSLLRAPGVRATTEERGVGDRWLNGVSIEPEPCTLNLNPQGQSSDIPYWWTCGDTTPQAAYNVTTKAIATNQASLDAEAWTAWVGKACTGLGMSGPRQEEERAIVLRRFNASIDAIVERELWTGQVADAAGMDDNPHLMDVAEADNLGNNFGFVTALAEIEQALAEKVSIGRRFIHAQPRLVTAWRSRQLVTLAPSRDHLLTELGTIVVPGSGYTGASPAGNAASMSHSWAYGTGPIKVFVTEPALQMVDASTVTRSTNLVELRAEAGVLIIFNPCSLVSAGINHCDEYCGAGS